MDDLEQQEQEEEYGRSGASIMPLMMLSAAVSTAKEADGYV
jgi:hypothetical protein